MERAGKIGDDWPVDVRKVRLSRTGQYLADAIVTWKLYDRKEIVVANGNAVLYDAETASFELMILKVITATFGEHDKFRLDVIAIHSGKQTTRSMKFVATKFVSVCAVTA